MDPASTVIRIAGALMLVVVSGYYAAARHALTGVRRSRLEGFARGEDRAQRLLIRTEDFERYIAAAELVVVIATIGLGWLAHGLARDALSAVAISTAGAAPSVLLEVTATAAALLAAIVLHTAIGVRMPRLVAMADPEAIAARTFSAVRFAAVLLAPLSRPATALARAVGRSFRKPEPRAGAAVEDLRAATEPSPEAEQEQMLLGVYHLRDTLAREVMTPRRDIVALPTTATLAETLALVTAEGHSRIPVYGESIDDIVGVLLVKDLLLHLSRNPDPAAFDLRSLVREPYFVPDTKKIGELLPELRTKSVHMAIVLDEFGGTDGLVTLEDMLEEIVGDIYDEHDVPEEETDFEITDEGEVLIDGSASIFDVNERFGLDLPEEDYDTIGGFVFGELGRVPVAGDEVRVNGAAELIVDEVEERRVTRVRLVRPSEAVGETGSQEAS